MQHRTTSREAAALEAAQRALDMLGFDLARYETTSWRCRDAARAYLAAGFSYERLGAYFERAFGRGLHDRVHSYEALPDEYVGNNMDLVADAYLAGGDVAKRLEPLAEVLAAVVKVKGGILPHRVQHALALWGAGRKNDARVKRMLAPVRTLTDDERAALDLNEHRARVVLAVLDGDAAEATRWLRAYDDALPRDPNTTRQRIHLVTLVLWLIARDRYDLHIPPEGIAGLPPQYAMPEPIAASNQQPAASSKR